ALSDAMVANTDSAGAFVYNYASMGFQDRNSFSVDFIGVSLDTRVSPLAPNTDTGSISNQAADAVIPSFYLTYKINPQYSLGFHLGVPFGLESVWPVDTFSQFSTVDTVVSAGGEIAGLQPLNSGLELFTLSPSLGLKINDHFVMALGLDYYTINKVEFNTAGSQTRGDGTEFGWNMSAQYKHREWSAGISYHSAVDIGLEGTTDITGMGRVYATTELGLPSRLQLGLGYALDDAVYLEFDIERVGWSQYDETVLEATGGALPEGTIYSVTENHWDDVTNYRVGLSYTLDEKNQLLFGAAYEETAQADAYFDATTADADRYMVSFGIVHALDKDWSFKAGYQYAWIKDRVVEGQSYLGQIVSSGGDDYDANGTDAYNGRYTGHIQMLSFGVSRAF
ncbi:MAG: outer membrane protein transport protein, partial [Gammaproteobacteria bacterium]|nr:outer membrane protein transport protein [Gammaproteobacteria bacterium]